MGISRSPWNAIKSKHSREMNRDHPNSEHQAGTGRAPALQEIEADAQSAGDEYDPEERDPRHMPGNPARYQRRDERKSKEMVHPKHNERHSEHIATQPCKEVRWRVPAR